MATAQETYREMMKKLVSPGLRGLGFKGSGQNYELPSVEYWAMIGFQKSAYSDANLIRVTSNVLVAAREEWDRQRKQRSYMPVRPTANTFWGTFVW